MDKEILKRFFEGKSSSWEKKQVQDYLQGDQLNLLDEYIKEQDSIHPPAVDEQYKLMFFDELTSNIKQQENQVNERKITRFTPWFKIAAAVIIICTASGLLYLKRQKQAAAETGTLLTKITNKGRNLKMVELADGTKIWMNPGTTITYNKRNFAGSLRQVSLIGEAYFNVTHNVKKPFQVRAGKLTTTVLGTSFNIEAYEKEAETRVMLVTGSVRVNAGKSQEMLRPGQLLGFSRKEEQVNVKSVDISDKQELFTHGKLVFENLPLKEALKRVERAFELKITIPDESLLDNKRITGNYYRDNAELALTRILFIHGLHHHKKGDHNYVIEP